jgi:hypothetical protein
MLLLIGGLSGAGKSTLGRYLEEHRDFRWVELDVPGKDVVDEIKIRSQWKDFLAGNPDPLIEHFPGNTVLTVPSLVIIDASKYRASSKIRVRYLLGPKEECFFRAHTRSNGMVSQFQWDANNGGLLTHLDSGDCPAGWKIEILHSNGKPRSVENLALAITS